MSYKLKLGTMLKTSGDMVIEANHTLLSLRLLALMRLTRTIYAGLMDVDSAVIEFIIMQVNKTPPVIYI